MACARRLLADSVAAVNHGRLGRGEVQLNLEVLGKSLKRLPRLSQLRLPVAVPERSCALIDARDAGARAVDTLVVIKTLAAEIAQRKMRHVQIVNVPL